MSQTKYICSTLLAAAIALSTPAKTKEDLRYQQLMMFPRVAVPVERIHQTMIYELCEESFSQLKQELSSAKYAIKVSSPPEDPKKVEQFSGSLLSVTCSWDEDYLPRRLKVKTVYYDSSRGIERRPTVSGEYYPHEKLDDLIEKLAQKIVVEIVTTRDEPKIDSPPSPLELIEFKKYYAKSYVSSSSQIQKSLSPKVSREISTFAERRAHSSRRESFGNGFIVGTGGGIVADNHLVEGSHSVPFNVVGFPLVLGYRWAFNSKMSASLESYSHFLMDVPISEDLSVNFSYYFPLKGKCFVSGDPAQARLMLEAGGGGTFTNRYITFEKVDLSAQPAASLAFGLDALTDTRYSFQFKFRATYSPNHLLKDNPDGEMIYPTNFSNIQFIMAYVL